MMSEYHLIEAANSGTNIEEEQVFFSKFQKLNEQNDDCSVIKFQGLQISPNYNGGYHFPEGEEVYWAYNATAKMILEDPTQISIMYHQDNINDAYVASSGTYNESVGPNAGDKNQQDVKHQWVDDVSLYPIPSEYISDLIQRVIQSEMRTELSTMSDERTDGMDTTKLMKRGS